MQKNKILNLLIFKGKQKLINFQNITSKTKPAQAVHI